MFQLLCVIIIYQFLSLPYRVLQNYAKWHLVFNLLQDLSQPFRDISDNLRRIIGMKNLNIYLLCYIFLICRFFRYNTTLSKNAYQM